MGNLYSASTVVGLHADRPAAPSPDYSGPVLFYEIDTGNLFVASSAGTWQQVSFGTGGGSGAILGAYSNRDTSSYTDSGPITATALPSMSITLPASPSAYTALISAAVAWYQSSNSHPNRFLIYLDGARNFPSSGGGLVGNLATDVAPEYYYWSVSGVAITIPGDNASHTIAVYYDVQASAQPNIFIDRSIAVLTH